MEPWLDAVSKVGFPIAVAAWVLFKLNGKMDRNAAATERNTSAINRLSDRLGVYMGLPDVGERKESHQ